MSCQKSQYYSVVRENLSFCSILKYGNFSTKKAAALCFLEMNSALKFHES